MYNASHYRRLLCLNCLQGRLSLRTASPLPSPYSCFRFYSPPGKLGAAEFPCSLKKRIKKEKLYLCVVEGPLFSFWTSLRSYHYFPVPFPCFEDCMSLSFQSKLSFLLAPCFGVILQTCIRYLLLLSEGNCSLLCPWTSALPLSLLLKEWCLFTWYVTQSLYLFPQLFIPFFCMS